ncbi:MAG: hypothetical protein HY646_20860 [Acidobacteria bacterium]|nr:hypothetical protein [Acidobacteriota bacterium]
MRITQLVDGAKGKKVMEWVDMRKAVAYLSRYREVSLAANGRYLDALAEVDDPTDAIQTLDPLTTRKQVAPKRTVKAFNPLARDDHQLFQVLSGGEHCARVSPIRISAPNSRTLLF